MFRAIARTPKKVLQRGQRKGDLKGYCFSFIVQVFQPPRDVAALEVSFSPLKDIEICIMVYKELCCKLLRCVWTFTGSTEEDYEIIPSSRDAVRSLSLLHSTTESEVTISYRRGLFIMISFLDQQVLYTVKSQRNRKDLG